MRENKCNLFYWSWINLIMIIFSLIHFLANKCFSSLLKMNIHTHIFYIFGHISCWWALLWYSSSIVTNCSSITTWLQSSSWAAVWNRGYLGSWGRRTTDQCLPGLQSQFGGSLAKSGTTKKDPVLRLINKLRKWLGVCGSVSRFLPNCKNCWLELETNEDGAGEYDVKVTDSRGRRAIAVSWRPCFASRGNSPWGCLFSRNVGQSASFGASYLREGKVKVQCLLFYCLSQETTLLHFTSS